MTIIQPSRYWQLHLSTLVALVFLASGLLWIEMQSTYTGLHSRSRVELLPHGGYVHHDSLAREYGWPWPCLWRCEGTFEWRGVTLAADIATLAIIIATVAVVFELRINIRRRIALALRND